MITIFSSNWCKFQILFLKNLIISNQISWIYLSSNYLICNQILRVEFLYQVNSYVNHTFLRNDWKNIIFFNIYLYITICYIFSNLNFIQYDFRVTHCSYLIYPASICYFKLIFKLLIVWEWIYFLHNSS
jgi:hypothetical protein